MKKMKCISPISLKNEAPDPVIGYRCRLVPCGRCYACLSNKRSSWSVRLKEELKHSTSAHFVTLTYDDDHLPLVYIDDVPAPTLSKDDVQKFMKRLRKKQPGQIRYFLVGEYGTNTQRPHYHALLFNIEGSRLQAQASILEAWKNGNVHCGSVSDASIHYCTSYIVNKSEYKHYEEYGLTAPFALMSRRPGIGFQYVEKLGSWHADDSDRFYYPDNAIKRPLPRFYRDKVYNPSERAVNALKMEKMALTEERTISFREEFERKSHANDIYLKNFNKNQKL